MGRKGTQCKDHKGKMYDSIRDMLEEYGIKYSEYRNMINKGYSLRDILEHKVTSNSRKCKDHKGNEYDSLSEMCKAYNVGLSAYTRRIDRGMTVQEALETPANQNILPCKDHMGNEFPSIRAMCAYYQVSYIRFYEKMKSGYSLEKALTGDKYDRQKAVIEPDDEDLQKEIQRRFEIENPGDIPVLEVKDHDGTVYRSLSDMCKHYEMSPIRYALRIEQGINLQKALTIDVLKHEIADHKGVVYKNQSQLLRAYHITSTKIIYRLDRGFNIKDILDCFSGDNKLSFEGKEYATLGELLKDYGVDYYKFKARYNKTHSLRGSLLLYGKPLKQKRITGPFTDHKGNVFQTNKEMCLYYGVDLSRFYDLKARGIPLEDILEGPYRDTVPRKQPVTDHKGNVFESIEALCKHYGIRRQLYYTRKKSGWTLDEILLTPPGEQKFFHNWDKELSEQYDVNSDEFQNRTDPYVEIEGCNYPVVADHKGHTYPTIWSMCYAYLVTEAEFSREIRSGYTVKEILTKHRKRRDDNV